MEKSYRYSLEKKAKMHICVSCGKKRMTRYIDNQTGEYLPEEYGRCARINNCGYHLNPYKEGYGKRIFESENKLSKPKTEVPIVFIPGEVLKHTFKAYEDNTFIQQLKFPKEEIKHVINIYRLGSISGGEFSGAVTIPYIDQNSKVRAIQVKQYGKDQKVTKSSSLETLHEKYYRSNNLVVPNWITQYRLNEVSISCLFGEHLLKKYPKNPVALIEGADQVIYATLYYGVPVNEDQFLFLSVENLSSLNYQMCSVLQGRDIKLFPSLEKNKDDFAKWKNRAKQYEQQIPNTNILVSDYLEMKANEEDRETGLNLVDYILRK